MLLKFVEPLLDLHEFDHQEGWPLYYFSPISPAVTALTFDDQDSWLLLSQFPIAVSKYLSFGDRDGQLL